MSTAKTLKRQLALALVFLFMAIIALGGSTYAWFSLNNKVTADGMKISAHTEGVNFEITNQTTGGYIDKTTGKVIVDENGDPITNPANLPDGYVAGDNAISAQVPVFTPGNTESSSTFSLATLFPTHPTKVNTDYDVKAEATTAEWAHAFSDTYDNAKALTTTETLSTIHYDAADGQMKVDSGDRAGSYALKSTFYVRLNPTKTGTGITIEKLVATNVQITGSSNLQNCIYLFAAGEDGASEISTPTVITNGPTGVADTSSVLVSVVSPADGEYHQIDLYAFFDGQDEDCHSKNYDANKLTITVDIVGDVKSS